MVADAIPKMVAYAKKAAPDEPLAWALSRWSANEPDREESAEDLAVCLAIIATLVAEKVASAPESATLVVKK